MSLPKQFMPVNKLVLPPLNPNKPSRGYFPYEPSYSSRSVYIISLEEQEALSRQKPLYPSYDKKPYNNNSNGNSNNSNNNSVNQYSNPYKPKDITTTTTTTTTTTSQYNNPYKPNNGINITSTTYRNNNSNNDLVVNRFSDFDDSNNNSNIMNSSGGITKGGDSDKVEKKTAEELQQSLEFLRLIFPDIEEETFSILLEESNGDVESIVDSLLASQLGENQDDSDRTSSEENSLMFEPLPRESLKSLFPPTTDNHFDSTNKQPTTTTTTNKSATTTTTSTANKNNNQQTKIQQQTKTNNNVQNGKSKQNLQVAPQQQPQQPKSPQKVQPKQKEHQVKEQQQQQQQQQQKKKPQSISKQELAEYQMKIKTLHELFPHIEKAYLASYLEQCVYDLDSTTNYLFDNGLDSPEVYEQSKKNIGKKKNKLNNHNSGSAAAGKNEDVSYNNQVELQQEDQEEEEHQQEEEEQKINEPLEEDEEEVDLLAIIKNHMKEKEKQPSLYKYVGKPSIEKPKYLGSGQQHEQLKSYLTSEDIKPAPKDFEKKLEQLSKQFPMMDPDLISSIYLESGFNFQITLNSIYEIFPEFKFKAKTGTKSFATKVKESNTGIYLPTPAAHHSASHLSVSNKPLSTPKVNIVPSAPNKVEIYSGIIEKEDKFTVPQPIITPKKKAARVNNTKLNQKDYKTYRDEASKYAKLRNICYQQAAQAYMRNKQAEAANLRSQGQKYEELMNQANEMACHQIFLSCNSRVSDTLKIDLHGLHVNEALEMANQVLSVHTNGEYDGESPSVITFITGRGSHSQGGVARIKPALKSFLKQYNIPYIENEGLIEVRLK
ncbi:hypothetical protein CYY_008162 [Polysphondylium violaceum]|uniref:Smr domain-containing protein n=1 Tax=Polysphondylium violaceum TaxID=133409 RepID=A0A8J4V496_9MYCE|nr:hypothetical protein CYY_008162 [Polysphondylium violaceum]